MKRIPYLRICVTEQCGLHCLYCRPGGEACRVSQKKEMSLLQIKSLVELMATHGISDLKITGGEPLIRDDIPRMVELLFAIKGIKRIELVTRSHRAGKFAEQLKSSGLSCLNFSLDSLDPVTFYRMAGNGRLDLLLGAIRQCANSGIELKFNMVVMKGINDHEIPKMIEYAGKYGAVLKLLDLMDMPQNPKFLSQFYFSFDDVEKDLSEKALSCSVTTPPCGIGTPMPVFKMANGATVMIKDARKGTWYGDTCAGCKHYPCQDAIMALRITSDGCLQRCLIRSDNLVNLLAQLESVTDRKVIDSAIKTVLLTYDKAVFHEKGWKI